MTYLNFGKQVTLSQKISEKVQDRYIFTMQDCQKIIMCPGIFNKQGLP